MLNLNQTPYISNIERGFLEEGHFLLKKIHLNIGKKNKPFLRMILADKTGHLPAIYFGPKEELESIILSFHIGDIINISGILEDYQDVLQLKILKLKKSNRKYDLDRFWRRTPFDRRELYRKLKEILKQIQNKQLATLCFSFLKDKKFVKLFWEAPASRFIHHAYIGGLLEHTLHVVQLAVSYTSIFENVDKDLLLAGAFLHDIGKVDEYNFLFDINHSSAAKLKGHTLLGYDRLQKKLSNIELEPGLRLKIEHILLSHQGKRIWGAIEEPKFLEAYLVHAADSTDSSQFIYNHAKKKKNLQNSPHWSDVISYLNREIYLG